MQIKGNFKRDGQECPSYTGKVTIRKSLKSGGVTAEVTRDGPLKCHFTA